MKIISKKSLAVLFILITLANFSACQNEEKSEQSETAEKIPSTMVNASNELEQIITLLGGPLFDGRDTIEKTKSKQLEMLTEELKKSSIGTQEETALQKDADSQEEKKPQEEDKDQDAQKGGKEDGSKDEKKEDGKEQEEGSQLKQDMGGGQDKEEKADKSAEENASDGKVAQKEQQKTFQYVDSLFGVPKWQEDNWNMIKVLTDGMHFTWNNLQPELFKKGISQNQSDRFSKGLEELTHNVNGKSIKEAQNAAFQMSQALSEFYSYYKTDIPPELKRITSHVTGIHFAVEQNDWPMAQDIANELQQEFTKLKVSIEDNQNHSFQMLELSVNDLCIAVQNQDSVLAIIRTNLVNTNINELELKLSQSDK